MKEDWKKRSIVYQIYPRSFKDASGDGIGDIAGIIEKIPYLVDLGVDAVWLSPVYASPMDDNGYDISNHCDIHPDYGTLSDLKALIDALHAADIRLIMDLVLNHTSDEHPWFQESRQGKDNPKRDYYIWRKGKKNGAPPNNWTSFFTGPPWTYDEGRGEYYLHLFGRKQPDLNWENDTVIAEIEKIIRFWIDLGVDGFRLDVINLISKRSGLPDGRRRIGLRGREHYLNGPRVHEYLRRLHRNVFSPHGVMTVGETTFVTPQEALDYVGHDRGELDMVFHFEHMFVDNFLKWFLLPFRPKKLKKVLNRWQETMAEKGWNALYFENHDQPRSVSRFGDDRRYRVRSAKMLSTVLYFQRGTPYIYQGQEIAMTNAGFTELSQYRDIETKNVYRLGRQKLKLTHRRMMKKIMKMSRDNARTPMQWSADAHAGFSSVEPWIGVQENHAEINVERQRKDKDSVYHHYKRIIELRKRYDVIVEGDYRPFYQGHRRLFVYTRNHGEQTLLVVANFCGRATRFVLPAVLRDKTFKQILSNVKDDVDVRRWTLAPYEARVFICHGATDR